MQSDLSTKCGESGQQHKMDRFKSIQGLRDISFRKQRSHQEEARNESVPISIPLNANPLDFTFQQSETTRKKKKHLQLLLTQISTCRSGSESMSTNPTSSECLPPWTTSLPKHSSTETSIHPTQCSLVPIHC